MCVELVNEGLPCRPLSLYNCLGSPFQQPQGRGLSLRCKQTIQKRITTVSGNQSQGLHESWPALRAVPPPPESGPLHTCSSVTLGLQCTWHQSGPWGCERARQTHPAVQSAEGDGHKMSKNKNNYTLLGAYMEAMDRAMEAEISIIQGVIWGGLFEGVTP